MENNRKIMVGCNILTSLDSMVYGNHCQIWYHMGKFAQETGMKFHFNAPRRVSIDNMRNGTIQDAIKTGCEYVFFYDDDVLVPVNAFPKLLALMDADPNISVASGLTYIRNYPYQPMLFRIEKETGGLYMYDDFKDHVEENGLLEKDLGAVGFSCVMLRVSYLEKLKPPFCITGSENTEDVYLCQRLNEHYPHTKIVCDTSIDTGHLVERYFVRDKNIEQLRKYEEVVNQKVNIDASYRGKEYAESIESSLRENQVQ